MANAPNLYKQAVSKARRTVATSEPLVVGAFDDVVADMNNRVWESDAADIWYADLQGTRTAIGNAVADALEVLDVVLMREPDDVPDGDWRATWAGPGPIDNWLNGTSWPWGS